MEIPRKVLWLCLLFAMLMAKLRSEETQTNVERKNTTYNDVVVQNKKTNSGGGGGGEFGWGWGGGGGGGGGGGKGSGRGRGRGGGGGGGGGGSGKGGKGWGWGYGGGGGGWYKWGCKKNKKKRDMKNGDYVIGVFAQCMVKGRCKGMRLDCPLHCGGPCFYDCRYMCKAHCKRS